MANRYFIASGATANWNDVNSWSETSGGVVGASIPTSSDNAIFDANSLSAPCNLTINAEANCLDLDFSGLDNLLTLTNSAYNLNVYGNLTLTSDTYLNTSFTGTGYLQLRATTSVNITSNGCTRGWNRVYLDGVGGTWTNQDDMNVGNASIRCNRGTWTTNDKTINCQFIGSDVNAPFIFNMSGSNITCSSYFSLPFDNRQVVINYGSSTLTVYHSFFGGDKTFYNVNILGSGNIRGNFTCSNLSLASTIDYIGCESNVLVNGNLTLAGVNSTNKRLIFASTITGTPRTITVNGSIIASNVDFRDITLAGTANRDLSAITGGSGDCGGNSGITFTPAQTQYFKHTSGAVNWSDVTKWFSDQAKTLSGRIPLPQDDVIFDSGSFTGESSLAFNKGGREYCYNFDCSGITYKLNIANNGGFTTKMLGDIIKLSPLFEYLEKSFNVLHISTRNNCKFYGNGAKLGMLRIGDLDLTTPYFDIYNNFSASVIEFPKVKVLFHSQIIDKLTSLYFGMNRGLNIDCMCDSTLFVLEPTGASNAKVQAFSFDANYSVWLSGTHTGFFDFTASTSNVNMFFSELIIDAGRKIRLVNGTTQTIGKLTSNGTPANKVTIQSTTAGSQATINYTGVGTPFIENVILKDINFTVPVYAVNGTNLGNNTNVKYVWKVAKKTMGFPIRLVKDE